MSATKKTGSRSAKPDTVRNPDSIPAQLEALAVDESIARAKRIPLDANAQAAANEWFDRTTRQLSTPVARVREANPKRKFTIERSLSLASSSPYLLCAVLVTRTL